MSRRSTGQANGMDGGVQSVMTAVDGALQALINQKRNCLDPIFYRDLTCGDKGKDGVESRSEVIVGLIEIMSMIEKERKTPSQMKN